MFYVHSVGQIQRFLPDTDLIPNISLMKSRSKFDLGPVLNGALIAIAAIIVVANYLFPIGNNLRLNQLESI